MNRTGRMTDERFAELLAAAPHTGTLEAGADDELLYLKAALGNFRSETLHTAERRSATLPSLAVAAKRSAFWAAAPQWSLAALAAVTIAAGALHFTGGSSPRENESPVAIAAPVRSSQADIAADNQLLSSIDNALNDTSISPLAEFGGKASAHDAGKHTTAVEVQD